MQLIAIIFVLGLAYIFAPVLRGSWNEAEEADNIYNN